LLPFTDPGILPNVPSTIYTSPEVASIGLSEKDAIKLYGSSKVIVYQRQLSHVDRAVCDNAQDGLIKIICSKKNLQILGATIVAPVAGEMISEIAVMIKAKMSFDKVSAGLHSFVYLSVCFTCQSCLTIIQYASISLNVNLYTPCRFLQYRSLQRLCILIR
jgi:pyruvate/2-oxoglutarate dehydrogenase complex dihydrolipoamide dehydrogenase (E3) component